MHLRVNCKSNDEGAWCKDKRVKRPLFGLLGARCCKIYGKIHGKCEFQVEYPRPKPPAEHPPKMRHRPLPGMRGGAMNKEQEFLMSETKSDMIRSLIRSPFRMPRCVCVDPLTSEPDGRGTNFCVGCSGIVHAGYREWYFSNKQMIRKHPKAGRNDPCPCGSGRKFKKCCKR